MAPPQPIPPSLLTCADWPDIPPEYGASDTEIALMTRWGYDAWESCKDRLAEVQALIEGET